jgi:crotonobetainyl-CoA:carnitine CoA-transferase CaiB-like acyl-CoA transferase
MYATIAITAALYRREMAGKGEFIDVSLMDAAVASMIMPMSFHLAGESTERGSSFLSGGAPFYNIYETADRKYIAIAPLEPKFWIALCSVLRLEKYQDKQLTSETEANRIRDDLAVIFRQKTRDEWVKILNEREIPCAPIYDVREVLADPHVRSRKMIFEMETEAFGKLNQLATPIRVTHSPLTARSPPPRLGEHTIQILQEIGYSMSDAKRLKSEGTI